MAWKAREQEIKIKHRVLKKRDRRDSITAIKT